MFVCFLLRHYCKYYGIYLRLPYKCKSYLTPKPWLFVIYYIERHVLCKEYYSCYHMFKVFELLIYSIYFHLFNMTISLKNRKTIWAPNINYHCYKVIVFNPLKLNTQVFPPQVWITVAVFKKTFRNVCSSNNLKLRSLFQYTFVDFQRVNTYSLNLGIDDYIICVHSLMIIIHPSFSRVKENCGTL